MNHDRIGLMALAVVVVLASAVFIWNSMQYRHNSGAPDTFVDGAGHVHVLGIELGATSLKQAEAILQSKAETALYLYPAGHDRQGLRLEAYFPAIADHTKVILWLAADEAMLRSMQERADTPRQSQNGVLRLALAAGDMQAAFDARVRELILIPSLEVSPVNLKARFGEPDAVEPSADGQTVYRYDSVGLSAALGDGVLPMLTFSNPKSSGAPASP